MQYSNIKLPLGFKVMSIEQTALPVDRTKTVTYTFLGQLCPYSLINGNGCFLLHQNCVGQIFHAQFKFPEAKNL